jgi:prevent-host-death family protein
MMTVSVAALKSELSRYLRSVRAGNEVVVTAHDHAVAKLVPYADSKQINIRAPRVTAGRLRAIKGVTPLKPCDPLAGLLEDRQRR